MQSTGVSEDVREVTRAGEAAACLVAVTLLRTTVGLQRWSCVLGRPCSPVEAGPLRSGPASGAEGAIGRAVLRASARLPYRPTCLDRAVAAQLMLRRRRSPGRLVVGLAPSRAWAAHAWLVGETGIVVGADEAARFTPATIFR